MSGEDSDSLRSLILTFRLAELQQLIGFAGGNKYGKKNDLQVPPELEEKTHGIVALKLLALGPGPGAGGHLQEPQHPGQGAGGAGAARCTV